MMRNQTTNTNCLPKNYGGRFRLGEHSFMKRARAGTAVDSDIQNGGTRDSRPLYA
jgi:hypothetical protein